MNGEHVLRNRASWDEDAPNWVAPGRRSWESDDPFWGIWAVPEAELRLLPEVAGLDTVELGGGTGYVSAWLARRGARPVGLDNSSKQLATARAFQDEFDLRFPLVHADAEHTPFADESFDFVVSEYGAAIWCDPYRWIPEAARVLRPGGRLMFLGHSCLVMLCVPDVGAADARLLREQFGMHRFDWPQENFIEFQIPHGEMVRLLRGCGLEIEDLVEVRAGDGTAVPIDWVTRGWASRWPSEEVWKARKAG